MAQRIGLGFDAHALVPGRKLIIGGVEIPFDRGLLGHSDGDVVLHAICDALLGAAGLGDIGGHFPDTDERLRGVDSRVLMRGTMAQLSQNGFRIVNLDTTILAQAPRMAPHVAAMIACIADTLQIEKSRINIKAKTTEWLGFTGRGEGIAAQAIALIETVSPALVQR